MMDLLARNDPAAGVEIDTTRLRAKVDERIGLSPPLLPLGASPRRPWLKAVFAFVLALLILVPVALRDRESEPLPIAPISPIEHLPGADLTIDLGGGGVKTTAVDGDTIWAMSALQRELYRIDAPSGLVTSKYPIDDHVEGVIVGGGYVWLLGYDDGGEVLRFDPNATSVDETISLGSVVVAARWFGEQLWLSTAEAQLYVISMEGELEAKGPGELKGAGLGYLWVNDPATGLIGSLAEDGVRGGIVIPTDGTVTSEGSAITMVAEAGRYLWLMEDGAIARFDPANAELVPLSLTVGIRSMVSFEGSLWVTSSLDHVLVRVDPDDGGVEFFALPGKPGGLFEADGSLWVSLYQPGVLLELNPASLVPTGERVVDVVANGHRLLCSKGASTLASLSLAGDQDSPTVLLDANSWIDYGSWAMVQAMLAEQGVMSCAHGYMDGPHSAQERASDLAQSLESSGVSGPYLLVAAVDGVHSTRLFAAARNDIDGMVLVDPVPLGFQKFYDAQLPGWGHPPWSDLTLGASDQLGNLGSLPLVVIGQDPERVFLNPNMRLAAGDETAKQINEAWQRGLAFYAGLSSDSTSVVAVGGGFDSILWQEPEFVVQQIIYSLSR